MNVWRTDKVELMNDDALVNVLYIMQQFGVEAHDPLIEALVMEAWRRLERFDITVLSKFSSCLTDQHLNFSPLMGKIADIVDNNLEAIQDLRALSVVMVSTSSLISRRFRERLVNKTELLIDTLDSSQVNVARRILQFLRNVKYNHQPLLEKCNTVFLNNMNDLDLDSISKVKELYQSLQFHSFEFLQTAKKKLTAMIPLCDDPAGLVKLFVVLGPLAGPEEKAQLTSTILLMSEELTSQQALAVLGAIEEMESRNSQLIKKIASVVHKHLDTYRPLELLKVTRALNFLHFQSKDIFVKLRELLLSGLKTSMVPHEMALLAYALSMLPGPHLDAAATARIQAVLPQCDLSDLNSFATCISKWIYCEPHTHLSSVTGKQLRLLQQLDHCGRQRLRASSSLDLLWEELRSVKGDWFYESLLENTMATLQQLAAEINVTHVVSVASLISKTSYLSTALLDRIASVVLQQAEKIHPFSMLAVILPFSILNYDPPQRDEFLGTCIQRLNTYLGTLDPLILVFLAFSLATLEYFPEELIKAIFNIKFLSKLDYQLEFLPSSLNLRVQFRLMELNRAVCLECPEFQIPWFHDRFCQQLHNKDSGSISGAQHQMYQMLAEILGGINCVRASVPTPYYYTLHFECILDKRKKPLPYESHNTVWRKVPDVHWKPNIQIAGSRLPPGAERIALEFLDARAFCRNIHHLKGISAMKKRHLEILGYRVIQIPHFEWNSMALSTKDAKMDYLKERIFGEGKSSS
ncbi:FAST kinase domain-containing protein 1, mitochondrial isoform X2 [Tenrec ecaudatus]|uniref:FAST kinase domain-containing protein 1, mitochondrial isoform X2 n=1 Tax=Tenrec ecaudatus TaxID=94439 RepID=UPI003F5A5AF6